MHIWWPKRTDAHQATQAHIRWPNFHTQMHIRWPKHASGNPNTHQVTQPHRRTSGDPTAQKGIRWPSRTPHDLEVQFREAVRRYWMHVAAKGHRHVCPCTRGTLCGGKPGMRHGRAVPETGASGREHGGCSVKLTVRLHRVLLGFPLARRFQRKHNPTAIAHSEMSPLHLPSTILRSFKNAVLKRSGRIHL